MSTPNLSAEVRTFVAIELPAPVIEALVAVQRQLAAGQLPLRLSAPAGLHLTLAFIGEIPAARVAALIAAVEAGCAGGTPLALRAEGLGMFPNARAPRVIWAGVQGSPAAMAALTRLRAGIVAALAQAGCPTDRHFDPHLTLARVRDGTAPADRARIGAAVQALPTFDAHPFAVDKISIMRSDLRPAGAIYSRLAAAPLHATP